MIYVKWASAITCSKWTSSSLHKQSYGRHLKEREREVCERHLGKELKTKMKHRCSINWGTIEKLTTDLKKKSLFPLPLRHIGTWC